MSSKPLRILCFGDSLTCGYPSGEAYADKLSFVLEKTLDREVETKVDGSSGELVINSNFTKRLKSQLEGGETYDWVIILGGTNDLGSLIKPQKVFETLKSVWEISLSKGSKVLALTIPEIAVEWEILDQARDELNEMILSCPTNNLYTFDLRSALPYHSLPEEERKRYWHRDGLHLTPAGYAHMGELIAGRLTDLIQAKK